MAGRPQAAATEPLPRSSRRAATTARSWSPRDRRSTSAASTPSQGVDFAVADRTLHALIGPNGAGKTTAFNLISGHVSADAGTVRAGRPLDRRACAPRDIYRARASAARSRSPTCFPTLTVEENVRLAVPGAAHRTLQRLARRARDRGRSSAETAEMMRYIGLDGHRAGRGRQRCPTAASACSTWALALAPRAAHPAARRAARRPRRRRAPAHRGAHQDASRPTSRCCSSSTTSTGCSSIADRVTVMNEGRCWSTARVEDARTDPNACRRSISAPATLALSPPSPARARPSAKTLLALDKVNTFYGKSHILSDVSLRRARARDRGAARPQRRRQIDAAEDR